jgi:hypothetical protein
MNFRHALITRFNVRYRETAYKQLSANRGLNPAWLAERFDLFEKYCLPSVLAQTCKGFIWLIYFDSETPPEFVSRARRAVLGAEYIHLVFCEIYDHDLLKRDVANECQSAPKWLLTTRLDNDDALRPDFVEQLRKNLVFSGSEALNFPNGIVYTGTKAYLHRDESNAFLSLLEPFEGFQTVLYVHHPEMSKLAAVRQIESPPAWLQVIHQRNVSNRVRGKRIRLTTVIETFVIRDLTLESSKKESLVAIQMDNLLGGPFRSSREACIKFAKIIRKKLMRRVPRRLPD